MYHTYAPAQARAKRQNRLLLTVRDRRMRPRRKLRQAIADAKTKTNILAQTIQPKPINPDDGRYLNGHYVPAYKIRPWAPDEDRLFDESHTTLDKCLSLVHRFDMSDWLQLLHYAPSMIWDPQLIYELIHSADDGGPHGLKIINPLLMEPPKLSDFVSLIV